MMSLVPVLVVILSGLMTGTTGFGFSVLSVPLLVLIYRPDEVVVLMLCLVPLTSLVLLLTPGLRTSIRIRLCGVLTLLSAAGLPLGSILFRRFNPSWLMLLIAAVIVGFVASSLYLPDRWRLPRSLVIPSGILGGLLATSTGLSGPAVAMYVHGRRLSHDEVVATMSAYVGLVSALGLGVLGYQGHVTQAALVQVCWLAPFALLGVVVGRWWARRNHVNMDRVALHALGLMGVATLIKVILTW